MEMQYEICLEIIRELAVQLNEIGLQGTIETTCKFVDIADLFEIRFFKADYILGYSCIDKEDFNESRTNLDYLVKETISDFLSEHFNNIL